VPIKDLTLIGIDEVTNRIRIGVATEEASSRLAQQLMETGIPSDMVYVEVRPPFERLSR